MRFPTWLFVLFAIFWIGPMMRWMFGQGGEARRRVRGKRGRQQEDSRLDSALEERDQVIEDLQRRINELESRLDFTERMLAGQRESREAAQV